MPFEISAESSGEIVIVGVSVVEGMGLVVSAVTSIGDRRRIIRVIMTGIFRIAQYHEYDIISVNYIVSALSRRFKQGGGDYYNVSPEI
ncbi:MAG: hypothetical protein WBV22_10300 [Anaerolineaceae bacterium]